MQLKDEFDYYHENFKQSLIQKSETLFKMCLDAYMSANEFERAVYKGLCEEEFNVFESQIVSKVKKDKKVKKKKSILHRLKRRLKKYIQLFVK